MRRCFALLFACAASLVPAAAPAQVPLPITPLRFAFPGDFANPPSATSASLALADRWLAEEPFSNPAAPRVRTATFSPLLQHVSRQDLRSGNRNVEEQAAFIDLAGGYASAPLGPVTTLAYFDQPALRLESNSYNLGRGLLGVPSAAIATESNTREIRAGAGFAAAVGSARLGLAAEWTRRCDSYDYTEKSGSPDQGHRHVEFEGGGIGVQAGARLDLGREAHRIALGAAARWSPAIDLNGSEHHELVSDTSSAPIRVRRAAGWEGGVSARITVSGSFQALVAGGGRSARAWKDFGITSGAGAQWSLGGEYHDSSVPWTLRFGLGGEQQNGVSESRAGIFGLGLGWRFQNSSLDFGLTHRSLARADEPNSYDDRLVATVTFR